MKKKIGQLGIKLVYIVLNLQSKLLHSGFTLHGSLLVPADSGWLRLLVWTVVAVDVAVGIGGGGEILQLVPFGIRASVM